MLPGVIWTPLRYLTGHGHQHAAAAYASAVISLQRRQRVRVTWDGADWAHDWSGGGLVTWRPSPQAPDEGKVDLPLFFHRYTPETGDVVIDVGAGIGTELKVLSELVGPEGMLIAIEADPVAFRRLSKLNARLGLTNTRLLQVAVAAEPGTAFLSQDDADAIGNMLVTTDEGGAIEVPVTTLDAIVEEFDLARVDYVKMNIEGAERDALRGFTRHGDRVRHWCISCHDFKGTEWATTSGFVRDWLVERGMQPVWHPEVPGVSHAGFYVYAVAG